MTAKRAVVSRRLFDGNVLHHDAALLIHGDICAGIVPAADIPAGYVPTTFENGIILPGFVDLQVNGGGGIMFNDQPDLDGLRQIAQAHRRLGTHAFLPTLISDTPAQVRAAIKSVSLALRQGMPGVAGLHLEGPHLSLTKRGAHDAAMIRPMTADDCTMLCAAAQDIPNLMVTVAPETCRTDQIAQLARHGIAISLGHSDCSYDKAMAAIAAGAIGVTHLFNAMRQTVARDPGLTGAALTHPAVGCGIIADGHHVHPANLRIASQTCSRIFAVTDAMAVAGTDQTGFNLNGRAVVRHGGRLTLADGTLAGADIDMAGSLRVLVHQVGVPLDQALAMVTSRPASILRQPRTLGHLRKGSPAHAIRLTDGLTYAGPV